MEPSRICSNFFLTYTQFISSAIFVSVFWAASGWWRFIPVTCTGKGRHSPISGAHIQPLFVQVMHCTIEISRISLQLFAVGGVRILNPCLEVCCPSSQ